MCCRPSTAGLRVGRRKRGDLGVGCPDFDGCNVWVVAGYLAVRSSRDTSIHVDQTAEPGCVGFGCRPVELPGAMVDMCAVGSDGWLLDQKDIQVLALVVIDECFHP